ncbi:MAG: RsbRD N-terminal domain-containing protein [Desulfobulbaceae bacterium]|nr:RsbRD N-terminal domain-containing protein [Desulfobulbaceae bacterium]
MAESLREQADLAEALRCHRQKIVERWVKYALSSYQSPDFFLREGDPFANPIGGAMRQAFDRLLPLLAQKPERLEFSEILRQFVQIRAVQGLVPSQALAPIYAVKHILRDILAADKERAALVANLYDFDFAVDIAALAAFDMYMESRERLYATRLAELKSGRHILTDGGCPSKTLHPVGDDG